MHQPDKQRAPTKAVLMQVSAPLVRDRFIDVAMDMDVLRSIAVAVLMKVNAIAP